jgi:hypothetical protein
MHFPTPLVAVGYLLSSAYLAIATPFPLATGDNSSEPLLPSQDPFYSAPPGYENTAPGTILRIRHAPGNLTRIVANTSAVYNIVFRTTDSNYFPSWAVTTVLAPLPNTTTTGNATHNSLLSLQIAYNTAYSDSTPSIEIYGALGLSSMGIPSTTDDISTALGMGWYVNMPDHEGPKSSFFLGVQEGHATLDSIRATLNSAILPSNKKTKYAMWGYSGGSVASTFAAELQEQYAPELQISGMAVGGLVPNMTGAVRNNTGSPYAGLIPPIYLGVTSQNPAARAYLVEHLKPSGPYNASGFLAALHYDINTSFGAYAGQNISDYFVNGWADVEVAVIQEIVDRQTNEGYHGVPQMPVFAYKAIHDQFTPVKDSDALVERWCGIGVDVRYERNEVGGHIAEITNGRLRALAWLKTVFDGTLVEQGCDVKNVTVKLTDNTE